MQFLVDKSYKGFYYSPYPIGTSHNSVQKETETDTENENTNYYHFQRFPESSNLRK